MKTSDSDHTSPESLSFQYLLRTLGPTSSQISQAPPSSSASQPLRIAAQSPDSLILSEARHFGWEIVEPDASPDLFWVEDLSIPLPSPPPTHLAIVTDSFAPPPTPAGYQIIHTATPQKYITLNTWFRTLCTQLALPEKLVSLGASLLKKSGVSAVVGSRLCGLKSKDRRFYLLEHTSAAGTFSRATAPADIFKDMCMSVLGIGHLPLFAANFATFATLLLLGTLAIFLPAIPLLLTSAITLLLSSIACLFFESWSARFYFVPDAREVVADEVAGVSLATLILACTLPAVTIPHFLLLFVTFRFFDIFKPGIHWVENLPIHGGVLWDDLLAGLYAALASLLLIYLF